ncbi:DEAD/DEAH box helicase [Pontibacter sp. BT310]|uniref:DEAD/DEAH box helicase n=1 Tax=Pontibacter populi TaxID=890055 RepID=A0ABS6XEZ2_9BACT|nr:MULTISPECIES: DEAD/DEAH box helicase [Pontibacter]MBJ6118837.1 DEAD/DEAH box helicase [Pontibacter sp. BT310]MBR0571265.1 DEAD/DEAH box helicase [Microvirga sp. STS03]MBW3365691.1 DEAD/DEAH box helicase [Pontibacter populi]
MTFNELNLIEPILNALKTEGYTNPTPIQQKAIPYILQKRDLLGCAQTGTGKTAAFAIPILQLLHALPQDRNKRIIKSLILTPTRELALQIGESFGAYGRNTGLKHTVIFGGVSQHPQTEALKRGVDILVATPGRLLDLMAQKFVDLSHLQIFVLDEADRMLDMGFVHDVRKVLNVIPAKRQSLFFSATMAPEIMKLADNILVDPAKVEVTPVSSTAHTIKQAVYYVKKADKKNLLIHLLKGNEIERALVFTRTKHGADRVVKDMAKAGVQAEAIHGNKSQNARVRALDNFKASRTRVLVATDIAARGIDVDDLNHVINYELPNEPETYVHRIGRTGRAGASGTALSFCDGEETSYLVSIQKLIAKNVPVIDNHPYPMTAKDFAEAASTMKEQKKKGGNGGRSRWGNKPAGASTGGNSSSQNRGGSGGGGQRSGSSRSNGNRNRSHQPS